MELDLFQRFAVALAIGGLIGLERERAQMEPGEPRGDSDPGIRTFPIIGLLGCLSGHLAERLGPWILACALMGLTVLLTASKLRAKKATGITTEISGLVVFLLGALCQQGALQLAAVAGFSVYLLLSLKQPLKRLVEKVELQDLYAIGKFGAITLIVLPLLPDQAYGPYEVWNPYKIWLLVILIAGINLLGYLAVKLLGAEKGFGLTGLIGGLASSTAVTLAFSRRSQEHSEHALACSLAIILACATMFPRVFVLAGLLHSPLLEPLTYPLGAMILVGLLCSLGLYIQTRRHPAQGDALVLSNPFELKPALKFALVFAVVLLVVKALQVHLGEAGLYLSGLVGGLADVDPMVLSVGRLSAQGQVGLEVAVVVIVFASAANSLVKGLLSLSLGKGPVRWLVPLVLFLEILAGLTVLWWQGFLPGWGALRL